MILSERELCTVTAVLEELLRKPYSELNKVYGTLTIKEMSELYCKLEYRDYCEEHGIAFEDMDDLDFEQAYREKWEA